MFNHAHKHPQNSKPQFLFAISKNPNLFVSKIFERNGITLFSLPDIHLRLKISLLPPYHHPSPPPSSAPFSSQTQLPPFFKPQVYQKCLILVYCYNFLFNCCVMCYRTISELGCVESLLPMFFGARMTSHLAVNMRAFCELSHGT